MVSVPKAWPGETVVCLAGGPSLTREDVELCRGRARVIAIKDAIRLAPWADALYACDAKWWRAHPETASYAGPKYGLEAVKTRPDVQILRNTGSQGVELQPTGLRTLQNSGGQAINLAVHFGAARILLLGYDMRAKKDTHHWFGSHPYNHNAPPPYQTFLRLMPSMVAPLKGIGVEVINCTPGSALTCFPLRSLAESLERMPLERAS